MKSGFFKNVTCLVLALTVALSLLPVTAVAQSPAPDGGNPEPKTSYRNTVAPMPLRYDDHVDMTGKTVEIVDAGIPTSYQAGYGVAENTVLDTSVVTLDGDTLIATGIGTATVKIDGQLFDVTVEKAKINIIVIMGQSNAGNHFANATSDITCPPGTAYWWGNELGTAAAEPVAYTQPSMGFHAPLLAELYAQSAAAGDPVKNVMIWQEGITSKNGKSIVAWAASATDSSGTDDTVTMIENCMRYYAQHSDKFEIVGKGVYWLQGESDTEMRPDLYSQCLMSAWNRLKAAGMEYLAFLRVRRGVTQNGADHNDLSYSASLSAQIDLANKYPDIFMATTLTENWTGTSDTQHTVDISNYITLMEMYGGKASHTDSYGNEATYSDGMLTTTMKTLYGSNNFCHYGKFGYALIGADAAYHMHHALRGNDFHIVQTDSSGSAKQGRQTTSAPGTHRTLDITHLSDNLSFRASCGSTAGTLQFTICSGDKNITNNANLIQTEGQAFGTINTELLRAYDDVTIAVTYTSADSTSGTVTYTVVDHTPAAPDIYFWDFETDLNARDNTGAVVNGFSPEALQGSYLLEEGLLKTSGVQLQLQNEITLNGRKNWSIEWKFGEVTTDSHGFLLCKTGTNVVGNQAIYHCDGQIMISDYADRDGYRNYTLQEVNVHTGDVMRITNQYDSQADKSVISLWQNNQLVIANFQLRGSINGSHSNTDMSQYPLSGDFCFRYMGCNTAFGLLTDQLEYLKITTTDTPKTLSMRYDDRLDLTGKTVEIIDAGIPTSYQVGYGVAENTVLDTAVVTLEVDTLIATGIGTATVKIDGIPHQITVTAAPISLLLLAGQSNMQGSEGDANQSIICPDGQVYSTYGDRYTMTVDNATNFAPSALTGFGSGLNINGTTTNLRDWPVYLLNEAGAGKAGPDSGFAYEWVKQTGEKVWVVNAAHGGTSIKVWQPGTTQYEECKALFTACQETLRKEIAAGHYTLSHMAYFWCQGCTDYGQTAEWYVNKYLTMHENFKSELAFDHDSNPETEDLGFEFAGIIPVRAGHDYYTSYRQGVYADTTTAKYHESFMDLRFTGPRVAQYWMTNNPELTEIWNVCNIGEDWVWMPDGTNGVIDYFKAHYANGTVDYTPQVAQKSAWYTPTTPAAVHDSIHYNQIGYNEVGRESARNALIMLGEIEAPTVETTVEFFTWDGYTPAEKITASMSGTSRTLVVPKVYPVWKSKDVSYVVSDGLKYQYYDLLADTTQTTGTLTADGAQTQTVSVQKEDPGSHFAQYLCQLPEKLCSGLNLWNELEHSKYYFANGTGWGVHSSGSVYSVTIPVAPGDKIYATSFGKAGENGNASSNGIRVTFFSDYGVAKTMSPSEVYPEFTKNGGYLIVPEDSVAANIAMWSNDDSNELYILNREHDLSSEICSICSKDSHTHAFSDWQTASVPTADALGVDQRVCSGCGETQTREVEGVWQKYALDAHLMELPEKVCSSLNLWFALEHDKEFFSPGSQWHVHSSGKVYSVTIPIKPGDRIFATAFGKAGENGGNSNGIRCTFFDAYNVAKTLDPTATYAEFTANGGYLIAPEGAIAVNVPMWNNSDGNKLYILNAEHTYTSVVTAPTCTEQGYTTLVCEGCGDTRLEPQTIDITDRFHWDEGYVISATGGGMRADKNWVASDYVDISAFDSIEIVTGDTINAGTTLGIAFYDANKTYVGGVVHTDKVGTDYGILVHNLEVPDDVVYLRTTWYSVHHEKYDGATLHTFYCIGTGTAIPALGHSYTLTKETAPTCTEQGTSVYTCADCGDSYTEYVNREEHTYDDGVCTVCGVSILGSEWLAPDFAQGDYTMIAIPDTQNLVTYWPEIYYDLCRWIADNKDTLNIQAVLHMGDMVNNNNTTEWTVCETGTSIINAAEIPWMPMRGNHDDSAWFNQYYDYSTYGTEQSWFGGSYEDGKLDHTYWFVTAGEREYMILSLGWAPSWDVLDWAQGIVEENSDKSVILACHAYMNKDGTLLSNGVSAYLPGYPDGDDVWNAFKGYGNVVLAMGGHVSNPDLVTFVDQNGAGQDVTSLLIDRQNDDVQSRLGMVAVFTFHADSNTVDVNWYSTRYDALFRVKNQFAISVPHVCDHNYNAVVTAPTCTEGGGTRYTCSICGYSYMEKPSEPLRHDYDTVVTAPTCTEFGYTSLICARCERTELEHAVDLTEQLIWVDSYRVDYTTGQCIVDADWMHSKYYDVSDYLMLAVTMPVTTEVSSTTGLAFYDASKNYISGVSISSGASAMGRETRYIVIPERATYVRSTWYSECNSGYDSAWRKAICFALSKGNPGPLGHNYESVVTAPTCTEQGYTTHTCAICGDSYVDSYVDASGHNYSAGLCTDCGEDTVTVSLEGNILTLTGAIAEGTRILIACYDGDGWFEDSRCLFWQGDSVTEAIPTGETISLFFVGKNWAPLRPFIPLSR